MKRIISLFFIYSLSIYFSTNTQASNGHSNSTGNWGNPSTWLFAGTPRVPTCGDTVNVDTLITVTVNSQENLTACTLPLIIYVRGILQFTNGNKLSLPCGSVVYIMPGGLVKKATAGGGNSTLIEICSQVLWNAGMGDLSGPDTLQASDPLPISLLYFNAEPNGNKVDVSWATASEINNDYFTVEKSTDAADFIPIATVDGAGNSSSTLDYFFPDYNPVHGISYYRLKQTDFDGQFSYSPIVTVIYSGEYSFSIISAFINGNSSLNLFFTDDVEEKCTVQLYDASGRIIYKEDITAVRGMNKKEIRIPELKPGIYFVALNNGTELQSAKFAQR